MGPVKNPSFAKQSDAQTRTLPFTQLWAKLDEQRLAVSPFDVATYWSGKNQFQCFSVLAPQIGMVPYFGTMSRVDRVIGNFWANMPKTRQPGIVSAQTRHANRHSRTFLAGIHRYGPPLDAR
jgi:hypothetical protein